MKNSILILAASLLALSSCTKKESSSNLNNSEFKIGISQEFENLNPLVMQMVATTYLYSISGRRLVNMDEKSKWVSQVVTEIPTLENKKAKIITVGGKKKVVAEWEILSNANWGDGKPVICEDFALAREIAMNPNVSVGDKESYAQVERIDIDPKNPKKCTFTYGRARFDYYMLGTYMPLPSHLEGEVYKKHKNEKEGYEKNSLYSKEPTNPGLYNGPYLISEIKLGDHVSFTPNPHFYGEKPKIQKVIVKLIPNTGTLEANLQSGTIDAIGVVGLDFDQATGFDKKVKAEKLPYSVNFAPGLTYEHIDMNMSHPILKDLNVRKALIQGLDRQTLIKSLFDGKQQIAIHSVSPKDPWYSERISILKSQC
jgi:peptide/nickel transport system substrate-binding protein